MTKPAVEAEVPFFDYPALFAAHEDEFVAVFREVGRRGAFIKQRDLAEFEQALAQALGVGYAIGVGNATDGLEVALRAAGIGAGDEVVFCSHTMLATAAAIHFAGGIPVPVDCGPDHLIDPRAVERAITGRTRGILPTHLNGRTCDMEALEEIARRHGLLVVEDAAQALGSRFRGRCAGSFGAAAAISFYPAKLLGCLGDGGAVLTSDPGVYERASQLCDFGKARDGSVVGWGFNSRLDNLQAALLLPQLKRYQGAMLRRRAIASRYQEQLGDLSELRLPPGPDGDPRHYDVYQNYEIEAADRDALREYLAENGIAALVQWGGKAVHMHAALGFTERLPYTEALFERLLMLPMNLSLADQDVDYVCDRIRRFYGRE